MPQTDRCRGLCRSWCCPWDAVDEREKRSLAADRPELQLEARKLARDVHREAARALELLPQLVVAGVELEVVEARVVRDLSRRYRQGPQADARQLQVHEVADALHRPDLGLRGKARAQCLA